MTAPNPGDYAHQCRYCVYCVFDTDELWWCGELSKYICRPTRPNRCAAFLWNDIPADGPLEKRYKPKARRAGTQMKLFDAKGEWR